MYSLYKYFQFPIYKILPIIFFINVLEETVPLYSDEEFFIHFRLSREVVANISERFKNSQYFNDQPGQYGNILPENQVSFLIISLHPTKACNRCPYYC